MDTHGDSNIGEMLAERRQNRKVISTGEKWTHDFEPLANFESFFAPVLSGRTIAEIAGDQRKKMGI